MKVAVYLDGAQGRKRKPVQIEKLKNVAIDFVKERNWELVNFYIRSEGESFEEEETITLIEDIHYELFEILIAENPLELFRNYVLTEELIKILPYGKLHIVTVDGVIDSLERGVLEFNMYANLRKAERESKSKATKDILLDRAKKGIYQGSIPPYGYNLKEGKLTPREDETVEVVKYIFEAYLQGRSFDAIADELTKRGYLTPATVANKSNANKKWHGTSVRKILENPQYTGILVFGRETTTDINTKKRVVVPMEERITIEDTHEPLIPVKTFELVQKRIESRKKNKMQKEN